MKEFFAKYLKRGQLKKQKPQYKQIEYQIKRAQRDLKTARLLVEADPEWAITVAYHAMLRAGRALLFSHGYLPADGAQHKTVVELTGSILGNDYKRLVQQFERMRRKRNIFFYESFESTTVTEAKSSLKTAADMQERIRSAIEDALPQLKLTFEDVSK
ncbi:MAG: HEPN domain-containing protein [Pseudomonadota bacterium]